MKDGNRKNLYGAEEPDRNLKQKKGAVSDGLYIVTKSMTGQVYLKSG